MKKPNPQFSSAPGSRRNPIDATVRREVGRGIEIYRRAPSNHNVQYNNQFGRQLAIVTAGFRQDPTRRDSPPL